MTEAEWLACEDPRAMLLALPRPADLLRRRRLLACACARRVWALLPAPWRAAVEAGERRAARQVKDRDLAAARPGEPASEAERVASWAVAPAGLLRQRDFGAITSQYAHAVTKRRTWFSRRALAAFAFEARLIREIFGNPFRPVHIDPAWLTPTVKGLATIAYEERSLPSGELDPSQLSVLADALEDAGCTDADLLGHLRSPGPHVRGCWAIDLILGKE